MIIIKCQTSGQTYQIRGEDQKENFKTTFHKHRKYHKHAKKKNERPDHSTSFPKKTHKNETNCHDNSSTRWPCIFFFAEKKKKTDNLNGASRAPTWPRTTITTPSRGQRLTGLGLWLLTQVAVVVVRGRGLGRGGIGCYTCREGRRSLDLLLLLLSKARAGQGGS